MLITDDRKLKAIKHIVNDYVNVVWTGRRVIKGKGKDIDRGHISFSFLLFQRSLAGFLSNNRFKEKHRKGDIDIIAKDFISSKIRFQLPEWAKWADHMNAHLFHLGYLRTRNSRPWNGMPEIKTMLTEFQAEWDKFCAALPPGKILDEFKEQVKAKRGDFPKLRLRP
jgi:hypothetical protein